MKNLIRLSVLSILIVLPIFCGCDKTPNQSTAEQRDPSQFTPTEKIDLPGCGNLYKVSDTLYRGEQPTAEGFKELQKLGIKTVVNLRSLHSDRDELEGASLTYEHIRMEAWDPEQDEIEAFLKIVTNPNKQPVFVHCQHGADRTGTMVAIYRVVIEGWDTEKAIDEMRNGPFGFHEIFSGLPKFIEKLDTETLRKNFATSP